jgi:hypothetical protein
VTGGELADPRYAGRLVLTGPLWPLGSRVGFVEWPFEEVVAATLAWRAELGRRDTRTDLRAAGLLAHLLRLAPLQAPPCRQLLVSTSGAWTASFDDDMRGGDPTAWAGTLVARLGCRAVVATHIPEDQYPYPATEFHLLGADDRVVTAGLFEDEWHFEAAGPVQPFEEPATYDARVVRNRFTRARLVRYLLALGIDVDEAAFYGRAVLLESAPAAKATELDLATARSRYAYSRRS